MHLPTETTQGPVNQALEFLRELSQRHSPPADPGYMSAEWIRGRISPPTLGAGDEARLARLTPQLIVNPGVSERFRQNGPGVMNNLILQGLGKAPVVERADHPVSNTAGHELGRDAVDLADAGGLVGQQEGHQVLEGDEAGLGFEVGHEPSLPQPTSTGETL
jgi:hypothetical protein